MPFVNETAPANREAGWSVTSSVRAAAIQFVMQNSASLDDVFDPAFGADTFLIRTTSSTAYDTSSWARVTVNFGSSKQINKIRVRYGDYTEVGFGFLGVRRNIFRLEGSINNSSWVDLKSYISIPAWGHDTYKEYSDYVISNPGVYQYYRMNWYQLEPSGYFSIFCGSIRGFDLYSGWFDSEDDEQAFEYNQISSSSYLTTATSYTEGHEPTNAFDGDNSTSFRNSDFSTILTHELPEPRIVNQVTFVISDQYEGGLAGYQEIIVSGSNDGIVFESLFPAALKMPGRVQANEEFTVDLVGLVTDPYKFFRFQFASEGASSLMVAEIKLGMQGKWVHGSVQHPHREVQASAITSIAYMPFRDVQGFTGLTSIGQGDNTWQLGPDYQFEWSSSSTGAIAGEYLYDEGIYALEMIPEIRGGTGATGSIRYTLHLSALAGFGRQCNADISWSRYELNASVTEVANALLMTIRPGGVEGFTGASGVIRGRLRVSGSAIPGVNSSGRLFSWIGQATGETGSVAALSFWPSVDGASKTEILASFSSFFPRRDVEGSAVVNQAANGSINYRFSAAGDAMSHGTAHGTLRRFFYFARGESVVGVSASGSAGFRFEVKATAIVDIKASGNMMRYRPHMVAGRTSADRFQGFILTYEAML